MAIKREQVARHILVPDTNLLWHEDKSHCVSPDFQEFLDRNANQYEIDLILPSVVFGELLFQQTTSALNALRKANSEFTKMSAVANRQYSHRVNETEIRRDVESKLNAWIASSNCQIYITPIKRLDWEKLIHDAIWRAPPFVEDKKTEKGFRDALIVETAVAIAADNPNTDMAFVSADQLVRQTADSRFKERCTCYETIEEFETFLKLSDEELTKQFEAPRVSRRLFGLSQAAMAA